MPRYELRLTLPDHPGSFGTVADVLGRRGANIVSFEAVDVEKDVAIDQLVVDLEPRAADLVGGELEEIDGVHVEAFRPVPRRPGFDGPLELVGALVRRPAEQVLQALVDGLPGAAHVDWAVVLARRVPQPRRVAASVGAPSLVDARTPWMPLGQARALGVDREWVPARWGLDDARASVAAAPLDDAGEAALLVVRRNGPAFRRRELVMLATLAQVAGRLAWPQAPGAA